MNGMGSSTNDDYFVDPCRTFPCADNECFSFSAVTSFSAYRNHTDEFDKLVERINSMH